MVDLQEDENSCFKAVAREAYRLSYGFLQSVYCPLDDMGNDLLSMRSYLARLGVCSDGVMLDSMDCLPKRCIFIAHTNRDGLDHFVLVRRRRKDRCLVYDPQYGYLWIDKDELWGMMSGRGLLVARSRHRLFPHERMPTIIGGLHSFLLSLIAIIRCVSIVLFMYSFNGNSHWSMPLSMGIIFALSMIANFVLNDKIAKSFTMNVCLPYKNASEDPDAFKDSLSIVTQELRIENDLLNRLTLLVVSFFVAINMNYKICLAFSLELLVCFFARWIFKPMLDGYKARISYDEARSLKDNEIGLESVWKKSRGFAFCSMLLDLLPYALAFVISMVTSLIEGNMSLEHLVNELIFIGGATGFIVKLVDSIEDYSLVRKYLYRCGTKLTDMLKKKGEDGMILKNRES